MGAYASGVIIEKNLSGEQLGKTNSRPDTPCDILLNQLAPLLFQPVFPV